MSDHPYQLLKSAQYKIGHYEQEARVARHLSKGKLRRRAAYAMYALAKWLEPELTLSFPKSRERTLQ